MQLFTPERQDLGKLGLTLEEGDLSPRMPSQLFAGVELPMPLRNYAANFGANPTFLQTGHVTVTLDTPASTAATITSVVTLGQGLWRVFIELTADSDFSPASPLASTSTFGINLQAPGGANTRLMSRYLQNLTPVQLSLVRVWLLVDTGWIVNIFNPATGVGQTTSFTCSVQAIRLL